MKTIAVVAGGDSSEYQISVKSGKSVAGIISSLYRVYLIIIRGSNWYWEDPKGRYHTVDKNNFTLKADDLTIRFDAVFIAIHGKPGENGMLQGYFDMLNIPYSTCDVQTSALTFNKWHCNNFLRNFDIPMARTIKLNKGEAFDPIKIIEQLGLPLFVKPNAGGSSFGVTKVKKAEELDIAVHKAWTESREALVDEYLAGKEFTCGLVRIGERHLIFPVTEVLPKNEFFDFEAKYTPGVTEEITPARLPEHLFRHCQKLSALIYDLCSCSGIVRMDYILRGETFYFLEVNTTPGMTETSFIPQQINAMGQTLTEILTLVIGEKLKTN